MGEELGSQKTTQIITGEPEVEKRLAPGAVLAGRYLIDGPIGIGGMGQVFRGRDLHFPNVIKPVAVKEMTSQSLDPDVRDSFFRNFEREANLIATLSHPAIPRIHDFFIQDEKVYLVLEFIEGKNLEVVLRESNGVLPEDQVVSWAIEVCDVLEYLHQHQPDPIIFRDVKPSNIMINQHDHVVLVDFGIAKAIKLGQAGTIMGTEGYSPPEQYRGEVTPQVDIYALGATLHHLLTGSDPRRQPPFTFSERPIHQLRPDVSPGLVALVQTALQYQPEDRFKTIGEMRRALQHVLAGVSQGEDTTEDNPTASLTANGCQPAWSFESEDEIRGSAGYDSGTIFIGSYDHNLYALDAANGEYLWKYPTGGGLVGKPVIAERFVFFGSEDGFLYEVSSIAGRMIWTYRTGGPVRSSPCIGEEMVFTGSDDGYLHAINTLTGRRVWRFQAGTPIRSTPQYVGRNVYFGTEGGDFYCLDLLGQPRWHTRVRRAITSSPALDGDAVYFGSMDGSFYAYDAQMGWELWRFRMGKGSITSPFLYGGMIFTGAIDGLIYGLDARSGREIWNYRTGHQVTGSPVVSDGLLYCGSVDGNLYCLDAESGRLVWNYDTGSPITGTPLIAEDMLYLGAINRHLYAFHLR